MKTLLFCFGFLMVSGFIHPFAQDGSVSTDNTLTQERIEQAHQNQLQEKRADKIIKEQQQREEEQVLPDKPLDDGDKSEMNDAEKLVE